jgi:hypothetical protein
MSNKVNEASLPAAVRNTRPSIGETPYLPMPLVAVQHLSN